MNQITRGSIPKMIILPILSTRIEAEPAPRPAFALRTALRAGGFDCTPPECNCISAEADLSCRNAAKDPPCTPPSCHNCANMDASLACFEAGF
jgi:hypothetical protein